MQDILPLMWNWLSANLPGRLYGLPIWKRIKACVPSFRRMELPTGRFSERLRHQTLLACPLFGNPESVHGEDLYEAHRAWLHEGLVVLRNKLVLYVEHSSNISRINPRLKNRDMETFLKGISRLKGINQSFIQAQEAIVRMTEMFLESCSDENSPPYRVCLQALGK